MRNSQERTIQILFVENDPQQCRAVEFYLGSFSRKGLRVVTVSTIEDAKKLPTDEWDVMLTDLHPGQKAKKELVEAVRAHDYLWKQTV